MEKDLSYKLIGCFYKVRNLYGSSHREVLYDRALSEVLVSEKIDFVDKPKISVYSLQTGKKLSYMVPDKLIADKIIVEIKAKPFLTEDDMAQAREYLKTTKYEILYLVNFSEPKFKSRRFIYTNDRKPFLSHIDL